LIQEEINMKVKKIYASSFAKLDSSVLVGGGTDETARFQAVLDEAGDEVGIHLIMDGAALVTQLKLYSNTTIECLNKDCGFYQVAQTNNCLITTGIWDYHEIKTRNIQLLGGTYHQNGQNQEHDNPHVVHTTKRDLKNEFNKHYVHGIEFYGVENVLIRDVTVRDFRCYAIMVGCFKNVTIDQVWLDLPYGTKGNQDGFHFWGPGQFLTVLNSGGQVGDDIINVGPDEGDKFSSITDVLIDGIFVNDGEQAVRLLSRGTGRLDRVTIRNVSGSYRSYGFYIDPWFVDSDLGNFGNIFIENVDLQAMKNTYEYHPPVLFSIGGNIECLTLKNIRHHNSYDNRTLIEIGLPFYDTHPERYHHYEMPGEQKIQNIIIDGLTVTEQPGEPENTDYIVVHDKIETMVLKNVLVLKNQEENGTLLKLAPKGEIGTLIAESIHTKGLKTVIANEEQSGFAATAP